MLKLLRTERGVVVPLLVALSLTYAYGVQSPFNANVVSRMALAICAATEGRLSIEPFQDATIDRSFRDGRFYSDKAPGLSLAALPVVGAVVTAWGGAAPDDFVSRDPGAPPLTVAFVVLVLTVTPVVNGLATAIAACAVYLLARRLGAARSGALFAALAFGIGTPAWGWATGFFGHALAGALAFTAYAVAVTRLQDRRSAVAGWAPVGLLLGSSVVTEYPLVVPAAIVTAMSVLGARRYAAAAKAAIGIAVGALGPALLLALYNAAVAGAWWRLPYEHVVGWEGMRQGVLGVGVPRAEALWGILVSERRGLLWVAPIVAAVPFAFWRARRSIPVLCWGTSAAVVVYFVLFNASYVYWDGGFSTGPRHLTPALAFACLPLAWAWRADRPAKVALGALLAASVAVSLACASTTMTIPPEVERPLRDVIFPALISGQISNLAAVLAQFYPGLPLPTGLPSLVPVFAAWAGAAALWRSTGLGEAEPAPVAAARRPS